MRGEFHQTAGFDSQLPGWLSSFLDVYPSAALGFASQATKKLPFQLSWCLQTLTSLFFLIIDNGPDHISTSFRNT